MSASTMLFLAAAVLVADTVRRSLLALGPTAAARNRLVATTESGPIGQVAGHSSAVSVVEAVPVVPLPASVRRRLVQLDLAWAPEHIWTAAVSALAGTTVVLVFTVGPVPAVVVATATAAAAAVAGHAAGDRASHRVERELPALLDHLAGSMRSGASLPMALHDAVEVLTGPLQDDLRILSQRLATGEPLADAVLAWHARRPTPTVRLVVTALSLTAGLGGHTAPLDGVATTLRDRLALEREVGASSAQARASATVIVATPFAFLAVSAAYDARGLQFLIGTPVGIACLVVGLALDLAGGGWMARIIRSVA